MPLLQALPPDRRRPASSSPWCGDTGQKTVTTCDATMVIELVPLGRDVDS